MSDNKRKYNDIAVSEVGLFDLLDLDVSESHFTLDSFAKSLNNSGSMELFKNLNVNQLNYAHDFYNQNEGFPGGLKTSSQYNILAVLFPRSDDRIYGSNSLLGNDGVTDGSKWNQFMKYRTSRGPTRNSEGNSTKNTFVWMELAMYMPRDCVPDEVVRLHDEALASLADESEGKFAQKSGSSFFLKARICKPYTMDFMNLVQSKTYCSMLDNKMLPVVLLKNFIIQKLPNNGGYIFSSQSAGYSKSSIHLVGSISKESTFVALGSEQLAIAN